MTCASWAVQGHHHRVALYGSATRDECFASLANRSHSAVLSKFLPPAPRSLPLQVLHRANTSSASTVGCLHDVEPDELKIPLLLAGVCFPSFFLLLLFTIKLRRCAQGIGGSLRRAGTTLTRLKAAEVMDTVVMMASTAFFFATVCFIVYQRLPLLGLL